MATALILVLVVAGFVGLAYAWSTWRSIVRSPVLPAWRRRAATAGLIAVTVQAAIFVAFWTPLFRNDAAVARWTRVEFVAFVLAVPCVLAGRGLSRWWLLMTSAVLATGCFFISLSP